MKADSKKSEVSKMGLILKGVVHSLTPGSERTVNMKDGSSFVSRKYKVLDVDAGKIFQVETIDHELDVEPSQTVSLPVFVTA